MKRYFAALVQRTALWDKSKPAHEQSGFQDHARFMHGLEAEGFIVFAGLMQESSDVLFLFYAESEDQVRNRLSQDPWQQDGHASLVRLEEIAIRTGAPQPRPEPHSD